MKRQHSARTSVTRMRVARVFVRLGEKNPARRLMGWLELDEKSRMSNGVHDHHVVASRLNWSTFAVSSDMVPRLQ